MLQPENIEIPQKGDIYNFTIIRVWLPTRDVGHASIETPRNYISLWPIKSVGKSEVLNDVTAMLHSLKDDEKSEGRKADVEICLYTLDVQQIDYYLEKILLPNIKNWALSGNYLDFKGKITALALGEHFKENQLGISSHSCASLVFHLLKVGGIHQIIPRLPPELYLPISKGTLRSTGGAILTGATAATVGGTTSFTHYVTNPKTWGASLLSQVDYYTGYFGETAKRMDKEATDAAFSSGVWMAKNTATALTFFGATRLTKTNFNNMDRVKQFDASTLLTKHEYFKIHQAEYEAALNHFAHPADALDITIITPDDIDRIIKLAVIFECINYPATQLLPKNYDPTKHKAATDQESLENLDISEIGWTPLHYKVKEDNLDNLKILWTEFSRARHVKTGRGWRNGNESLLHIAAKHNSLECLNFMLQKNELEIDALDQNFKTPLITSIEHRHPNVTSMLIKHSSSMKKQLGEPTQGYIRHKVDADGNCGHTAFGITREDALECLTNEIMSIRDILKPANREALITEGFYNYLINNKIISSDTTHKFITEHLEQFEINLNVLQGYLYYDVRDKQIDMGWVHPCVLQALAHLQCIELHIWQLGEQAVLIPHHIRDEDYSTYIPPKVKARTDLLFINGNHFDRLEFVGYEHELSNEPTYPLDSSQGQHSVNSSCCILNLTLMDINYLNALHWATKVNNFELFQELQALEPELIFSKSREGKTVAHLALKYKSKQILNALPPNLLNEKDFHGKTPLDYAYADSATDYIHLLKEGANAVFPRPAF